MRTTLTIEDDVAATLEQVRKKRNIGLKEIINEALRLGLRNMTGRQKPHSAFRTKSVDLGCPRVATIDNIAETLAIAESEDFD